MKMKAFCGIALPIALILGVSCQTVKPELSAAEPPKSENRIDVLRGDAPELAAYGNLAIGSRTLELVNKNQIDVRKIDPKTMTADSLPRCDRPVTVEVWYPADPAAKGSTALKALMRDGKTVVELQGKAVRDAAPAKAAAAYPLVIVSHGYPGNRFLMSPIAENIASKGYVVVSIDHTDSTYDTLAPIQSALVNRSRDQLFVLDQIAKLSKDSASFLYGLADADNTAVIGYSMGGYGTLISVGAGLTKKATELASGALAVPFGLLKPYESGSEAFKAMADKRIKTAVTFAPAGMSWGWFDAETLKGVRVPVLFIAGSIDDTVGYENGVRATWQAASSVDRSLLTFVGANHNAGAPMAPPREAYRYDASLKMHLTNHYIDAVWDNTRMNNISEHFITAWLGKHLKADAQMDSYLSLVPEAEKGVWAVEKDGSKKAEHSYWKGFPVRTAKGLRFENLKAGE